MPSAHANSRSSSRESIPLPMRVYGLEGITETQDEAISQHAVTLAVHDERLGAHDVSLAVLTSQVSALVVAATNVNGTLNKLIFAVIAFAFAVAASAVGVVLGT